MTTTRPEFQAHDDFIFEHKKVGKVTREEFIKYVRSSHEHMRQLSELIQQYNQTIEDYLDEWDGNLESFDEDVKDLLGLWIQDGTMDHIINENLMSIKADKEYVDDLNENVTAQLAQKIDEVTFDIGQQIIRFLSGGKLINTIDLSEAENAQAVQNYIDTLVSNGQIEGVTLSNGSVGTTKLAKKVIADGQTSFLQRGKNLFDKDNALVGWEMNPFNGNLIENTNYVTSEYIPAKPNQEAIKNVSDGWIIYFDSQFKRISHQQDRTERQFTMPANTEWFVVSIGRGYLNNLMIEFGDKTTPYEDFKHIMPKLKLEKRNLEDIEEGSIPFEGIKGVEIGKNLFDKEKVRVGRVSPTSGEIDLNDSTKRYSEYIDVVEGEVYSKNKPAQYAFYDSNLKHKVVEYDGVNYGDLVNSFVVPDGASKIRLSPDYRYLDTFQFEKSDKPTPYERFQYSIKGLKVENKFLPKKYPNPPHIEPSIYRAGNSSYTIGTVDKRGIYSSRWDSKVFLSTDNYETRQQIFDVSPYLNDGETISLHALIVSDTGRIIVSTNQGRVLVSNEEQTDMQEVITWKSGYTYTSRGYSKKGKYIALLSYGNYDETNPPREVILSKDHGATWDVVFEMPISEMTDAGNWHLHDVEIDLYRNMLIVSNGDNINAQIHYSYDWGETWNTLTTGQAPLQSTTILAFPEGIAFGSDEIPEGIAFWTPPNEYQPKMEVEDIEWVVNFGGTVYPIGHYAMHGDVLHTKDGFYGIIPFRNHNTVTPGKARLYATGDGGRSWHEVYTEENDNHLGFYNLRMYEYEGEVWVLGNYTTDQVEVFQAKLPNFYEL